MNKIDDNDIHIENVMTQNAFDHIYFPKYLF